MVLLIGGHTRSSAELMAFGFRKAKLGKIVGSRTAGAMAAGRVYPTPSGALLYLAASLLTVDGQILDQIGINPDTSVPMSLPYAAGSDPQLEAAILIAADLIRDQRPSSTPAPETR